MPGNNVQQTLERSVHPGDSENREHSKHSRGKEVEVMVSAEITKYPAASSDFPEDSPNSLPSDERKMDNGEAKVPVGDSDGQYSVAVSEFRELSPNSWVVTEGSGGRQKKQHTRPVCVGEPSEYSPDSLGVGNNVSVPNFSWFKSMSQIVGLTATWQDKVEGSPMGASTASNAKINTNPVHTEFNFFL